MTHYGCVKPGRVGGISEAGWACPMLARIMLREELDREPTEEEVDRRIEKLKLKLVAFPSVDTIVAALESGTEVRPVFLGCSLRVHATDRPMQPMPHLWRLECEAYEVPLQQEIAITFPDYQKQH